MKPYFNFRPIEQQEMVAYYSNHKKSTKLIAVLRKYLGRIERGVANEWEYYYAGRLLAEMLRRDGTSQSG